VKLHRVAKLFPEMTTVQFKELVEDIKANGQIEPILVYDGQIADGHHRYKACRKLKIAPKTVRWKDVRPSPDTSLVDYVIAKNLKRRHLEKQQRAAVATDALPLYEAEAKARQKKAAATAGKASGAARRKKAEGTNVPAKLRERSPDQPTETTEDSKPVSAKKAKTEPKKTAKDREKESTAKAAKQAGVSARYVQEAKAIGKKSKTLLRLLKEGAINIPLAKKLVELDPPHLKSVLAEGKKEGNYKQALDSFLDQIRPGTTEPSQKDLVTKLKRATRQAEALNTTLEAAAQMAKKLNVEKGQGLIHLIGLTDKASTLAKQIAGD
jgi:ParB-like chromosome segregation protein Spo0J